MSQDSTAPNRWQRFVTYPGSAAHWYKGLPDGSWLRVELDAGTPGQWRWAYSVLRPTPEVLVTVAAEGVERSAPDAMAAADAHVTAKAVAS